MKSTKLQTPVAPFGTSSDYQFSPDGTKIAFVSRVPEKSQSWETNTDIYLVSTKGDSLPKAISSLNIAYDTSMRFSPDGKSLIWLMMVD